MKIGILTGGGDCPGLNAVIYGVLLKANESGHEVIGIEKGWKGFLENITRPLKVRELENLHQDGGTLLYTSRTNPFASLKKLKTPDEKEQERTRIIEKMSNQFSVLGIEALVVVGGDDTLGVANELYKIGKAKVIGVPKTIDNDLSDTDYTFGFWSAVELASDTMDNLKTTARSHQRVFIVQIMGRDAGWLTLASGVSAGADIILIPEKPFDLKEDIIEVLRKRVKSGFNYHIIACAEGATPSVESLKRDFKTISKETLDNLPKDNFGNPLLYKLNMSQVLLRELELRDDLKKDFKNSNIEYEVRDVILGHTMRAGTPIAFDRLLGLRLGIRACDLVNKQDFGKMVSLKGENIEAIPLSLGAKKKLINHNTDWTELMHLMSLVKN